MRIETERLVLRDFVIDDWLAVLAYQRDARYNRYYPDRWVDRSDDEVRAFVQRLIDDQREQPRRIYQVAITLPETGEVIGNCGIRRKPGTEWEADIGYELNPEHWGHGYATEVARTLVSFGFRDLGLHRISARCIADNAASANVLRKVGMRLEGRIREHQYFQERWWDSLDWGLLEKEWAAASDR
ncbi:MAG: N-acetyltransferase [Chloroflexi bacterium]|nr:MAG: N-acetyltransferase [Chloroflexota bacterium]